MAHAYVTFRIRLARHALADFIASFKSSGEIVVLVFGQVLIGLFALIAMPPMAASALPFYQSIPLLLAHGMAMSLPLFLLRRRVLPRDVVLAMHPLPIPPRIALAADALVAGILAGPLALAYIVSAAIWMSQGPEWLQADRALPATVFSFLVTCGCSSAILHLRARGPRPGPRLRRLTTLALGEPWRGPRIAYLWHRLFWLPFWRGDNVIGHQQSALLLGAIASAVAWTMAPAGIMGGVLDLTASASLILLADRGDKAVREQLGVLRPIMAAWPLQRRALEMCARAFSLAPVALLLALLFGAGLWQHTAGHVYLTLAMLAPVLLVAIPRFNPRARVGLVVASIVILTAVGSEIWN
ncbi:hypothetical protein [Massilia sp. TWR1-2-2]|uniref:hypothetical protein n=1 Tax=Massilia sp. TWR1-2-2 TaxID=2804584 RepID=UPI003CE79A59